MSQAKKIEKGRPLAVSKESEDVCRQRKLNSIKKRCVFPNVKMALLKDLPINVLVILRPESASCRDGESSNVTRSEASCSVNSEKAYSPRPSPGLDEQKCKVGGGRAVVSMAMNSD